MQSARKGGGAERARISQPEGLRGPNVDPGGRLQVSGAAVRLRAQACQVAFAFCGVCSARGASPTAWHGNDRRAWSRCTGTDRLGGRPKGVLRAATALSRVSPLAIVAGASAARRSEVSTIFTLKPERPSFLPLAGAWKGSRRYIICAAHRGPTGGQAGRSVPDFCRHASALRALSEEGHGHGIPRRCWICG